MYTKERINSEIERLKKGEKTRIYAMIVGFTVILVPNYLHNGFNDDMWYILVLGLIGVLSEVEKLKIVKMMMGTGNKKNKL